MFWFLDSVYLNESQYELS